MTQQPLVIYYPVSNIILPLQTCNRVNRRLCYAVMTCKNALHLRYTCMSPNCVFWLTIQLFLAGTIAGMINSVCWLLYLVPSKVSLNIMLLCVIIPLKKFGAHVIHLSHTDTGTTSHGNMTHLWNCTTCTWISTWSYLICYFTTQLCYVGTLFGMQPGADWWSFTSSTSNSSSAPKLQ